MNNEDKKTLLLVEDEAIIALAKQNELERYGYNVLIAHRGEKAVILSKENRSIDLILMDIDLGHGIDGTEAAGLILKNRELPIVFMSSHTEPEIIGKTEKITSYGYVVKSAGITALDASIKMAFKLFDAHQKVEQHEERLLKLDVVVEQSHEAIVITNLQGDIEYVNPKFSSLSGYSQEELLGNNPRVLQSGQTPKETFEELWETVLDGKVWNGEFLNKKSNGELYWENAVISPIFNKSGDITHFVGIKEDTSHYKQTTKKFNKKNNSVQPDKHRSFYHAIVEALPVLVCRYTANGTIVYTNKHYCNFVEKTAEELLGSSIFDIMDKKNIEYAKNQIKKLSSEDPVAIHSHSIKNSNGELKWFQWIDRVLFSDTGRIIGYLAIGNDITEYKK